VKRALISHQKLVRTEKDVYEGPTTVQASKTIDLHCQEAVRFVTIVPETWSGASFNLTVKMKHSVAGQTGVSLSEGESAMFVFLLSYVLYFVLVCTCSCKLFSVYSIHIISVYTPSWEGLLNYCTHTHTHTSHVTHTHFTHAQHALRKH